MRRWLDLDVHGPPQRTRTAVLSADTVRRECCSGRTSVAERPGQCSLEYRASAERVEACRALEPEELPSPAAELNDVVLREGVAVRDGSAVLVPGRGRARAEDAGERAGDRAAIGMQCEREGAVHVEAALLATGLERRAKDVDPVRLSEADQLDDAALVARPGGTVAH